MAPITGTVQNVTDHVYASELTGDHATGATSLTVVWTNDFNADGGTLYFADPDTGDVVETIAYTIPHDDEDVPSETEIDLATPLANDYADATPVYVSPKMVERWCWFMPPDGEEAIVARVPHNLVPLLPTGARDADSAEQIECEQVGTDLVVADVLARTPGVDGGFLDDDSVLGDAIASEQIVGRHILADDLMAQKIAAILIVAATLKTADDGQRIEIDVDGIRWYDENDNLGIFFPTASGQPAILNADLVAATLDVLGGATFRSTANSMEIGSTLQLQSGQSDPVVGPSVQIDYDQLQLTGGNSAQVVGTGLFYTATGGAGGATSTYIVTQDFGGGSEVEEYRVSDGTFLRDLGGTAAEVRGVVQATVGGVRKLFYLFPGAGVGGKPLLVRTDAATLVDEASVTLSDIPNSTASSSVFLGLVNGNPTVCTFSSSSGSSASVAQLLTYDGSTLALLSTQNLSGRSYTPTTGSDRFVALVDDGTSLWVGVRADPVQGNINHRYNKTTWAYESGHDFTSNGTFGSRGLAWDGTQFWSRSAGAPRLWKHTSWDWTTEDPHYWFAYSWYDGTHETLVSPLTELDLTNYRRARVTATVPTFPGAASHARLYVARNATQPATTALLLQAPTTYTDTDTAVTQHEIDFNASGAAPPTSNSFGTGTAAEIKSQIAGTTPWRLRGDGTFKPPAFTTTQRDAIASPSTGYLILNITTAKLNFYDGSAWREVTST